MHELVWSGLWVGFGSISIITVAFYPLKLWAKNKSSSWLFRVFSIGILVRFLVIIGIAFWGFLYSPLSGLVAILSFGTFFLVFTCFETYVLKLYSK